jgi:hypothetical protein
LDSGGTNLVPLSKISLFTKQNETDATQRLIGTLPFEITQLFLYCYGTPGQDSYPTSSWHLFLMTGKFNKLSNRKPVYLPFCNSFKNIFYPRVYVVYRRVYILLCCCCCSWEAFKIKLASISADS